MIHFGIILSGCGVYDGSEIHEAVMAMLAVDKAGHRYSLFAPDKDQHRVVNHLDQQEMQEKRNVLTESARIARGEILPLARFDACRFDALILPGGIGAAQNLSDFASQGEQCNVEEEVARVIKAMSKQQKPIGAMCISPAIVARVLKDVEVTAGKDSETENTINKMGARHIRAGHGEVVVDKRQKVCTTPCYMLDAGISQIAESADNLVYEMCRLL